MAEGLTITNANPLSLIKKKEAGEKIVMLTAYEYSIACLLESVGVDVILVGDSVGNVFSGHPNTLSVTLEHMIYHTQAVVRGAQNTLVVADMPFLTYQVSAEQTKLNAGRLIKEGGAQAVKIEIGLEGETHVEDIVNLGVPVIGHLGFTPQMVHQLGGYKVQGKKDAEHKAIVERARLLEKQGCFCILLEMVPSVLAEELTELLSIPTIGIGAGTACDGQVLVTQDLLGMGNFKPKFVKQYADLNGVIKTAVGQFKDDVVQSRFPASEHTF